MAAPKTRNRSRHQAKPGAIGSLSKQCHQGLWVPNTHPGSSSDEPVLVNNAAKDFRSS
jgi:hypothetical protein